MTRTLSISPEGHQGRQLADKVAETENDGRRAPDYGKKETKSSKMKLCCITIDTTYARTIPGIMYIMQLVLLAISFLCLIMESAWPDMGTYAFYCIFLVISCIITGYLLFTILMGSRGEDFCGVQWSLVELVYFCVFGFLIFLGACLAANKSEGKSALNAAAVFGFFAMITFGYLIWNTWKVRKEANSPGEKKEKKEEDDKSEDGNLSHIPEKEEPPNDIMIEMPPPPPPNFAPEDLKSQEMYVNKGHSLPMDVNHLYINTAPPREGRRKKSHRRQHSASEKDSAYSEGELDDTPPARNRRHKNKMRRTGSRYEDAFSSGRENTEMENEMETVLHRQPLAHISRYGNDFQDSRLPVGYPGQSADNNGRQHRSNSKGSNRNMPDWLKVALRREENIEESSENDHHNDRNNKQQFPLPTYSDEESIMFPSVSQQHNHRGMQSMPPQFNDTFNTYGGNRRSRSKRNSSSNYFKDNAAMPADMNNGGGGHRSLRPHRHHNRRGHGHRSHHKGKRTNHIPQRHIDGAYGDYIRNMMGNDKVVIRNESVHNTFPQQSASAKQQMAANPVMEKYFNDL